MAGTFRITPDQMHTRAGEYRTEADNLGQVISKMDQLLSALEGEWEGSASEAFVARYQELRPKFVDGQTLITEIASALDATANDAAETDSANAARWQ